MTNIVCVGAIYIDNILTVPHFPLEDQKLRASKRTRRRGGNCGNTLEVLGQLTEDRGTDIKPRPQLHLLSVLPEKNSLDSQFIRSSLKKSNLSLDEACIYRDGHQEAASSFVIKNEEKGSRTIVSISELPEMTLDEFAKKAMGISAIYGWYHFEGRVPEVTLECVVWLRTSSTHRDIKISVELENPERAELEKIVPYAHVIFYSKLWATASGFTSARDFLKTQIPRTQERAILCCTWGSGGATIVEKSPLGNQWESVDAWKTQNQPIVDTIGAGDTFIAGMLYMLSCFSEWSLNQKLGFANQLAGRKVTQEGFDGLGVQMNEYKLESED